MSSYRDLRAFTEILRSLHYPHHISPDSFRRPNPLLTYQLIQFLLSLYNPNVKLPQEIESREDRVRFFNHVAQICSDQLRLSINVKALYASREESVGELLKIAQCVWRAERAVFEHKRKLVSSQMDTQSNQHEWNELSFIDHIKTIRRVSSQLNDLGARLGELVSNEVHARRIRERVINRQHNVRWIRQDVQHKNQENLQLIRYYNDAIKDAQQRVHELENIKKRKQNEYDRTRNRLDRLSRYKPAHLEELEKREAEMQILFDQYTQGYRNIQYLEHELQRYKEAELLEIQRNREKIEQLRRKLHQEEKNQLLDRRVSGSSSEEDDESTDEENDDGRTTPPYSHEGVVGGNGMDGLGTYSPTDSMTDSPHVDRVVGRRPRPTSRRRPQSSNLGRTQKKPDTVVQGNMMYDSDEEDGETEMTGETDSAEYSTSEEGETVGETGSEERSEYGESTDDEI